MAKAKDYKTFPGETCEKLRNLVAARKKAEADRQRLFDSRDEAKERIAEASDDKKRRDAESDFGHCVFQIGRLQRAIKALNGDIDELVESPDQAELFDHVAVNLEAYLKAADKAPAKDEDDLDSRPIGRKPNAREPAGNTEARAIQDGYVDGVDEHLRAATSELVPYGLSTGVCAKVTALGLGTIGQIAKVVDGDTIEPDLETLNPGEAKAIVAALKKYRTAHRAASAKVEKESGGVI